MASKQCVVLAARKPTQERIQHWLTQLGHEAVFVSTHNEMLVHPLLATSPLLVMHIGQNETIDACRQLRQRPETALLPQAVLADTEIIRQFAYEAGVDAVFLRHSMHSEILARLQTLVNQRQFLEQWTTQRMQVAQQGHEQLRQVFRRYVSAQLADQIMSRLDVDIATLTTGTRAHAAVMFADMRGFTGMAERLAPARVCEVLNEFFTSLTAVAFRHDGTVFNMAGDSLMVGFGVPMAQADGSIRALRSAREMLVSFAKLSESWQQRFGIETGLGIGINEGEVVAGNIGSEQYMNYTLIGDTVNVAARLSQRARAGEVLFSMPLKLSLDAEPTAVDSVLALPPLTLRGRTSPIDIFCVPTEKRVDLRH